VAAARFAPFLILLASAVVVGTALLSQYVGGLQPCELCLYQRWPYYGVIAVTLAATVAGNRRLTTAAMALAALAFLVGAGLAFYHVGIEQHWFAGPTACTGGAAAGDSLEDFRRRLLAQQPVACDQPQWTLFGVSLAGWNLLASLGLVVLCVGALRRAARAGAA
jgi:disulfide bond formation protein DsbB